LESANYKFRREFIDENGGGPGVRLEAGRAHNLAEGQTEVDAQTLAHKCASDEPEADDKVNQILAGINLNMDDILERARARKAGELAHDYAQHQESLCDRLLEAMAATSERTFVC
jgi:hypothetical protein